MGDLAAALCLVVVIEGLFLFVSPDAWKRMVEQARQLDSGTLRKVGAGMAVAGLILLQLVR